MSQELPRTSQQLLAEKTEKQMDTWTRRVRRAEMSHSYAATKLSFKHYFLGGSVVILTAVIGSSVFATLQKETTITVKIFIASASILAAILAALQTFLRYAERAEQHRNVAIRYKALKHELELKLLHTSTQDVEIRFNYLYEVEARIAGIDGDAPTLPQSIFKTYYIRRRDDKEELHVTH
jgi:hypothetical protein